MSLDEWIYHSAENVYPEREVVPTDKTRIAIKQAFILARNALSGGIDEKHWVKEWKKIFGDKLNDVNVVGDEQ